MRKGSSMNVTLSDSVHWVLRRVIATMASAVALAAIAGAQGPGREPAPERSPVAASFSNAATTLSVPPAALPGNLRFPRHLRPVLEGMWRDSPSFRRQCSRLGEAPHMKVMLNIRTSGARTYLDHAKGRAVSAIVWLDLVNLQESIPHELEHVLESIDGVDVRVSSARSMRGVKRLGSSFETERAREVGATVARELRSIHHPAR
jgi:hypothetical protein